MDHKIGSKTFTKAEDGALKIKGANIKGRDDWYGIMKIYKGAGIWLNELAAYLEAEKESEIEKRVAERMRAKEEETWRSTPGSHAGHDDDDNWDWDGPTSRKSSTQTRGTSSGKMMTKRVNRGGVIASRRSSLQPKEEW